MLQIVAEFNIFKSMVYVVLRRSLSGIHTFCERVQKMASIHERWNEREGLGGSGGSEMIGDT
jgi:hypothetical protein